MKIFDDSELNKMKSEQSKEKADAEAVKRKAEEQRARQQKNTKAVLAYISECLREFHVAAKKMNLATEDILVKENYFGIKAYNTYKKFWILAKHDREAIFVIDTDGKYYRPTKTDYRIYLAETLFTFGESLSIENMADGLFNRYYANHKLLDDKDYELLIGYVKNFFRSALLGKPCTTETERDYR